MMKLSDWISKRQTTNKQKLELSEKQKLEKSIEKEKSRKDIEKYRVRFIGFGWLMIPSLAYLVLVALFFWDIWINKNNINWLIWAPLGVIALFTGPAFSIESDWEGELKIKSAAGTSHKYDSEYLYTDSKFNYITYELGKKIVYFINVLAMLAIIAYIILSISNYTPTFSDQLGIIVFLLIFIAIGVWFKR